MCVFCAVASYVWREEYGKKRYHLAMDTYVQVRVPSGPCTPLTQSSHTFVTALAA